MPGLGGWQLGKLSPNVARRLKHLSFRISIHIIYLSFFQNLNSIINVIDNEQKSTVPRIHYGHHPQLTIRIGMSAEELSMSKFRVANHFFTQPTSRVRGESDSQSYSAESEGSVERKDSQQEKSFSTTKFYFAPAPGKMGYLAAVSRFLKVKAMVWAGSQVTKLIRAAGALALAPLVDRGLSWFTAKYKIESRGKAFFTIVVFCLSLAVIMFLVVTLLWA